MVTFPTQPSQRRQSMTIDIDRVTLDSTSEVNTSDWEGVGRLANVSKQL